MTAKTNLLTTTEAADYLGITPGTLEVWRCTKKQNIEYIRVGRKIKYRKESLDRYLESRTINQ